MQKWRKFTLKFLIQFLNKYELIIYVNLFIIYILYIMYISKY